MGWAGNVNLCFGDFKFITYAKPNGTSNEYIRMIQELMNGACNAVFSDHSSKKDNRNAKRNKRNANISENVTL